MADLIHYSIRIFACIAFWEKMRMFSYEADDIESLCLRRLEAGHTVATDNELVSMNTATFAVCTTIARPSHSVTTVELIACILQYFLYADASLVIVKG
jgi:hypothetical protein